eukprot:RCo027473
MAWAPLCPSFEAKPTIPSSGTVSPPPLAYPLPIYRSSEFPSTLDILLNEGLSQLRRAQELPSSSCNFGVAASEKLPKFPQPLLSPLVSRAAVAPDRGKRYARDTISSALRRLAHSPRRASTPNSGALQRSRSRSLNESTCRDYLHVDVVTGHAICDKCLAGISGFHGC